MIVTESVIGEKRSGDVSIMASVKGVLGEGYQGEGGGWAVCAQNDPVSGWP
jgi:hypothetical protein